MEEWRLKSRNPENLKSKYIYTLENYCTALPQSFSFVESASNPFRNGGTVFSISNGGGCPLNWPDTDNDIPISIRNLRNYKVSNMNRIERIELEKVNTLIGVLPYNTLYYCLTLILEG